VDGYLANTPCNGIRDKLNIHLAPGYLVHSLKEYFIPESIINHYQPIYDCSTALLENILSSS
jgi:hypothetical protein